MSALAPYLATLGHIEMLQAKIDRLEAARQEAEHQVFHAIGRDFTAGQITTIELTDMYNEVRRICAPGFLNRWNDNVPVNGQQIVTQARNRRLYGPNGADKNHWSGHYPLDALDPAPMQGVPVVYVLFNETTPVYVGSSHGFRGRLRSHHRNGKIFDFWIAYPCKDREDAYRLEVELLKQHKLPLNKRVGR